MLYSIVGILVIIIDQAVKYWVSNTLFGTDIVRFIPGVISLVNVHNDGAAFSFLSGGGARIYFIVVTGVFALLVVIALATGFIRGKLARWSLVLVTAGGLGNMIDRVMYGYVQDMFKVELFNFAIFNVADVFITVFAILFAIAMIFEKPESDGLDDDLYDDEDEYDEDGEDDEEKSRKRKGFRRKKQEEEEYISPAKRSRQEKYEREYEEYKAQQREIMRRQAEEDAKRQARIKSKAASAKRVKREAASADDNPFLAWENANAKAEERSNSMASRAMGVAPKPQRQKSDRAFEDSTEQPRRREQPVQEDAPAVSRSSNPKPQRREQPEPAVSRKQPPEQKREPERRREPEQKHSTEKKEPSDSFDLDDILAEFK